MIVPAGSAPAPYYTQPSLDFSRPGRMWLPVAPGQTRFRLWFLTSAWYHEGVPGHHLQLAQWQYVADSASSTSASTCASTSRPSRRTGPHLAARP
nr:DUF885 family protein [uncultured Actinoplanes sp.]